MIENSLNFSHLFAKFNILMRNLIKRLNQLSNIQQPEFFR